MTNVSGPFPVFSVFICERPGPPLPFHLSQHGLSVKFDMRMLVKSLHSGLSRNIGRRLTGGEAFSVVDLQGQHGLDFDCPRPTCHPGGTNIDM